MIVVWNVVLLGNAAINVPEVVFAKESLGTGNVGLGVLVGATGLGPHDRELLRGAAARHGSGCDASTAAASR